MREVAAHHGPGLNEHVHVIAMDGPGSGGASHHYRVEPIAPDHPQGAINPAEICFQYGPITECGVNGCSNESILAVVIDRLQGFQMSEFACYENGQALLKLEEAMHWLQHRTRARMARGVEGTSQH